jgi:hypothetical protein
MLSAFASGTLRGFAQEGRHIDATTHTTELGVGNLSSLLCELRNPGQVVQRGDVAGADAQGVRQAADAYCGLLLNRPLVKV